MLNHGDMDKDIQLIKENKRLEKEEIGNGCSIVIRNFSLDLLENQKRNGEQDPKGS